MRCQRKVGSSFVARVAEAHSPRDRPQELIPAAVARKVLGITSDRQCKSSGRLSNAVRLRLRLRTTGDKTFWSMTYDSHTPQIACTTPAATK